MLWLILALVLSLIVWYRTRKSLNYWSNRGVPHTKPWSFLGDQWTTLFRRLAPAEFVVWIYNTFPNSRYSGLYQFTFPVLLIRDPELIKQIAIKDFDHFTDHKPLVDHETDPLWAGNLLELTGQKWRHMRTILSGSFTSSKLKVMFNSIEEKADNFIKFFLDKNEDEIEVEMKDSFTRFTNDVIVASAFGIQCNSFDEPDNSFYQTGKLLSSHSGLGSTLKVFGSVFIPQLFRLFKIGFFNSDAVSFFQKTIEEVIQTREKQNIVRPDMINLLLEAGKGYKHKGKEITDTVPVTVEESAEDTSNEKFDQTKNLTNLDIISQALVFFFVGFDTVACAMSFGSYELVANKHVQDKLRKEIKDTYEKNDGKMTYEALLKMKYLDMVVSEILRKWPPAPSADRVCTKPYVIEPVKPEEKPVQIKVGEVLLLPIHAIHRDEKYYPNPEDFDPERFSDENKSNIMPCTYMPFGAGARHCIGSRFALLQIKALFFKLLLNFEMVPSKKSTLPLKLDRNTLMNTAEGGFWFALKRIKH